MRFLSFLNSSNRAPGVWLCESGCEQAEGVRGILCVPLRFWIDPGKIEQC